MLKKLPKRACPELAEGFNRSFIVGLSDPTKLWLLYAVLFCSMSCKYVGVAEGNLFFFGGGERKEGKSSFAVFGFGVGGADCKCAFSFAVDFAICFVANIGRM